MNNVLVAIAVVLIAVLSAAFAAPRLINWENYRGVIEEEATRLLGRDVRVGGAVRIRILPSPTFSIEKIRVADTEANTGQPFFEAEALHGRLAIAPLLRGVLQASEVVLHKPQLLLVLDDHGGGNWKTLGVGAGSLPFQVSDVALESVQISGGGLAVFGADRAERLRLEAIDGVLSAQALDGPFRFRGTFGNDVQKRDIRVSTSRQEADGSIRFKAALHHNDTGATYNFDARAVDLARSPRLEGELSAKVSLPALTGPQQPAAAPTTAKSDPDVPVEVKAALSADLKLVRLANLTLSFERFGRPQILTGDASIDLGAAVTLDTRLSAKWLDLDQVIGVAPVPGMEAGFKPSRGPIEGLLTLAQRLNGFVPDQGQIKLALDVEQANLGREAVSGLRLSLQGKGAETDIRELRLGLPGGSQADVKGLMTGSGEETSFSGDIVLRGSSLTRFLAWASVGAFVLDPARDGTFAMRARLDATPGSVQAREFTGELAGTIMQGELGYRWQGRPEVSVLIEGPRVDLRTVLGTVPHAELQSIAAYLAAASTFGAQAGKTDAVLRVRAGELLLPGAAFFDTAADLEVRDGRLRVSQLRFAADHGVTIDIEGDMPTGASQERSAFRGIVSAATAEGVKTVMDLIAVPEAVRPPSSALASMTPLRLAGQVMFSAHQRGRVDIAADGDLAGTRVTSKVRLDLGLADVATSPMAATAALSGQRAVGLARLLLGAPNDGGAAYGEQATVAINVSGTARERLVTEAAILDGERRLAFNGISRIGNDRDLSLDGDVEVTGATAAATFAWLTNRVATLPATALTGRARLTRSPSRTELDGIVARVGATDVRGVLTIDSDATISGRLNVGAVSVGDVLQTLVSDRVPGGAGTQWSSQPFNAVAMAGLSADIAIETGRLNLPTGVGLEQATFQLALRPGRMEWREIKGRAAGGAWSGAARLDTSADGGALTLALRLQDVRTARLQPVTPGGVPPIDTSVSGAVTINARGQSPNDLIAAATGRGSVTLTETKLAFVAPGELSAMLGGALRTGGEQWPLSLRQQLTQYAAKSATLLLPARTLDIEVKNGVATSAAINASVGDGKVLATAAIDLVAMTLNGTWHVESAGDFLPPPPGWMTTVTPRGTVNTRNSLPPLPPVVATWTAPLGAIDKGRIDFATEALEREVSVRKVERDLEDLERLRRLDEERAREDAERRRLQENGAAPFAVLPGATPAASPADPAADPSTEATAVPDTIDPSLRVRPAPAPAPAAKPAYRPMTSDEQRAIFNKN